MERACAAIHAHCPGPASPHPRPCALVAQALGGSVRAASVPATCFDPRSTLERSTVSHAGGFFAAAQPRSTLERSTVSHAVFSQRPDLALVDSRQIIMGRYVQSLGFRPAALFCHEEGVWGSS